MTRKIAALCLLWICLVIATTPVLASTEYAIPNSSVVVGVSSDAGINISYSTENPSLGARIYSDTVNATWAIPPDKSPDGKLDIIIVPAEQQGFWSWLTSWF